MTKRRSTISLYIIAAIGVVITICLLLTNYLSGTLCYNQNQTNDSICCASDQPVELEQQFTEIEITKLEVRHSDNVTDINEDTVYINWILEHSSRISRQTATDIYTVAMSMDNGLLLVAIANRESSFSPTAISKKGAIGLNQIMPGIWANELIQQGIIKERKDLFDCDKNLKASHYIITKYYDKLGSWKKALNKYVGIHHKSYDSDVLATYGELQLLKNTKHYRKEKVEE